MMASLTKRKNGTREIQWTASDGRKQSLYLGKTYSKTAAQTIRVHVEALIHANLTGTAPPQATSSWVASLEDPFHRKLERAGLVSPRGEQSDGPATLGELWTWFLDEHGKGSKPRSMLIWKQAQRSAIDHFGADKLISDISKGNVDSFTRHLATSPRNETDERPLAPNTYRKRLSICRQVFRAAVRNRWLEENPFGDLKGLAVRSDKSKQHFVTIEDTEKLIAQCPNAEWRLIVALSRYGGLRIPSEGLALTWDCILWDQNKIRVPSPKTAHHEGKEERIIPLFGELLPYLEESFALAPEGSVHVITKTRDQGANWRTTLTKKVRQAGMKPWPKLVTNMRASRATELEEQFPSHVVRAWLGHSEAVAREHYLQVMSEHYSRACSGTAKSTANSSRQGLPGKHSTEHGNEKTLETPAFPGFSYSVQYTPEDSNL